MRHAGFGTFFLSGICAISSSVVVSLLQERWGFAYGVTGTLLSAMSVGNLLAGFLAGVLPGRLGRKRTVLLLAAGYAVGYALMGCTGAVALLLAAFFLVGVAKGGVINTCTILVGDNSADRTRGMNLMHACYACGALLCPFLIAGSTAISAAAGTGLQSLPMLLLAALGVALWGVYAATPMQGGGKAAGKRTDWSFLRSRCFWLLTGLLFCQNAAETGVTGWLVTYFKGSGILTGTLSTYTVTVMWGATLIARLLIAFVFPFKNPRTAMVGMSGLTFFAYILLMNAHTQVAAIALLFAFAFAMAGMNPTAVACAGRMTSVTSIGILLPVGSFGAVVMPWCIGMVAQRADLQAGMMLNLVPCLGLILFALAVRRLPQEEMA
jgi:fucose permease